MQLIRSTSKPIGFAFYLPSQQGLIMLRSPTLCLLFLAIILTSQAQTVFWQGNVEGLQPNFGGGTRAALNHTDQSGGSGSNSCGSSGYFYRTDCNTSTLNGFDCTGVSSVFYGVEGTYIWRGEDLDGCRANPDVIEYSNIDITGRMNLEFRGLFACDEAPKEWEGLGSPDNIAIFYSIDNGPFIRRLSFASDGSAASSGSFRGLFREDTKDDQ